MTGMAPIVGCSNPECRPQLRAEIRRLKKIMRRLASENAALRRQVSEPTPSPAFPLCPEHAIRLPCPACLPWDRDSGREKG